MDSVGLKFCLHGEKLTLHLHSILISAIEGLYKMIA